MLHERPWGGRFSLAKILTPIVLIAAFALLSPISCAQLGLSPPSDFTKMSPKQKAVFFMTTYNQQYALYKANVALPNLTADQKKLLVVQKKILMDVYPIIQVYDLTQAEGKPIDPATEAQILALINQLVVEVAKK